MRAALVAFLLVWLSSLPFALGSDPSTGSAFMAADVEAFVVYHNKIRSELGVEPV